MGLLWGRWQVSCKCSFFFFPQEPNVFTMNSNALKRRMDWKLHLLPFPLLPFHSYRPAVLPHGFCLLFFWVSPDTPRHSTSYRPWLKCHQANQVHPVWNCNPHPDPPHHTPLITIISLFFFSYHLPYSNLLLFSFLSSFSFPSYTLLSEYNKLHSCKCCRGRGICLLFIDGSQELGWGGAVNEHFLLFCIL